jgi:CheY-like chemotaxis protein
MENGADVLEVLLVEDNPTDAELTMHALSETSSVNSIVWVKDGAAALDFVYCRGAYANKDQKGMPSVILLDLQLPKVSGIEVLQALKADPQTRSIPIVVLTSSRLDRDVKECYRLGVNSYVSKPVEFAAFAKAISSLGYYWLLVNQVPR